MFVAVFAAGKTIENKCVLPCSVKTSRVASAARMTPLMMGRAAAVRAQTKGKTGVLILLFVSSYYYICVLILLHMYIDAAKAKTNARYGKMISMAVKTGGNDPIANRQLAKLIEQAKALGVPKVPNSCMFPQSVGGVVKPSVDSTPRAKTGVSRRFIF